MGTKVSFVEKPTRIRHLNMIIFILSLLISAAFGGQKALHGNKYYETCDVLDKLEWDGKHNENNPFKYEIPVGSFCSSKIFKPHKITCEAGILPKVTFFYRLNDREQKCIIDMTLGLSAGKDCMNHISQAYATNHDETKLIWIAHGFKMVSLSPKKKKEKESWQETLKDSYFKKYSEKSKVNPIVAIIDWNKGANWNGKDYDRSLNPAFACHSGHGTFRYGNAAINTWPVGRFLALLNQHIKEKDSSKKIKTYCVGHSLGAHVCGFMGKTTNDMGKEKLEKIIALDPAGPIFDYSKGYPQDVNLRLNENSAKFVEALITNTALYGFDNLLNERPGHINIYINGANHPYCRRNVKVGKGKNYCLHSFPKRLLPYVIDQIDKCGVKVACPEELTAAGLRNLKTQAALDKYNNNKKNKKEKEMSCYEIDRFPLGDLDNTRDFVTNTFWLDASEGSNTCYAPKELFKS